MGLISQQTLSLAYVGQGLPDIPRFLGSVLRLYVGSHYLIQHYHQLIQIKLAPQATFMISPVLGFLP